MISILGWPLLWRWPGLRLCVWLFSSWMGGWAVEESWLDHAKMAGSERTCHELAKSVPILTHLLKNSKVSGIGLAPLRSLIAIPTLGLEGALDQQHLMQEMPRQRTAPRRSQFAPPRRRGRNDDRFCGGNGQRRRGEGEALRQFGPDAAVGRPQIARYLRARRTGRGVLVIALAARLRTGRQMRSGQETSVGQRAFRGAMRVMQAAAADKVQRHQHTQDRSQDRPHRGAVFERTGKRGRDSWAGPAIAWGVAHAVKRTHADQAHQYLSNASSMIRQARWRPVAGRAQRCPSPRTWGFA